MRASNVLSMGLLLAATIVSAAWAQSAPSASQDPHHSPAQTQAAPAPGAALPMPRGAGSMGMMGSGGMSPMMGGMGDHMAMMQMMGARTEGRLAFLKTEIAITEAQLPAWNAYADAVRAEAKRHSPGMPAMQVPAATWIDRLAGQERDLERRLDSLRRLKDVSAALYDALSVSQKKTADELLGGPMGRM
jgi:hypothetical protein